MPNCADFHCDDQTVVVTGASGGIGRQTALRFAQSGARVIVHANTNVESVAELVREIHAFGGQADMLQADFSSPSETQRFVLAVYNLCASVDVWVNAAGLDLMMPEISSESFCKKMRQIFEVDVFAAVQMSRDVGFRMLEKKSGTIVFFSWNGVHFGWNSESAQLYGAAKGALLGFSRSLAEQLAPSVQVRCLSLGWIRTRWGQRTSEKWESAVCSDSLQNRWGTPEEIADFVLYLSSDMSRFVDGIDVRLDGGKRGTR